MVMVSLPRVIRWLPIRSNLSPPPTTAVWCPLVNTLDMDQHDPPLYVQVCTLLIHLVSPSFLVIVTETVWMPSPSGRDAALASKAPATQ